MALIVKRMEDQLGRWSVKLDRLAARTQTAGTRVSIDARVNIDQLRCLRSVAQVRLDRFKIGPPEDTQREESQAELTHAWNDLVRALRSKKSGVRGEHPQARRIATMILLGVAVTAGCTSDPPRAQSEAAPTPEASEAGFLTLVIPEGTIVVASLATRLSTKTNHAGDPFGATTVGPIHIDDRMVVPPGTRVRGTLRDVTDSGRTSGRARMTLVFESMIDSQGKIHTITAQPLTLHAASTDRDDVEKNAAGGLLGALNDGAAVGGKAPPIGAGAGAEAGSILVPASQGDDVALEVGRHLTLHLTSATAIEVLAQR